MNTRSYDDEKIKELPNSNSWHIPNSTGNNSGIHIRGSVDFLNLTIAWQAARDVTINPWLTALSAAVLNSVGNRWKREKQEEARSMGKIAKVELSPVLLSEVTQDPTTHLAHN